MTRERLSVWPPLNPAVLGRQSATQLPFPLEDPKCRLFSLARHALRHALPAVGLEAGDRVLVPAYHHGSEVEAMFRAGIDCLFYDATDSLAPDEKELEAVVDERVKALYLIHYLGFPQDVSRWRRWCDERGLLLIEDAAQAWLTATDGRPVGAFGDVSFFCLYKTFGLPDGAALLSRTPPEVDSAPGPFALASLMKRHAAWLEGRSARVAEATGRLRRESIYTPAADFDLGDPYSRPSQATVRLLSQVVEHDAAARRRVNYELLRGELGDLVDEPFSAVPPGASPFAFPIRTDDKSGLLEKLADSGVVGLNFWSEPHPTLDAADHPEAARRRAETIGLPVHQELRTADLERIVDAVKPRRSAGPRIEFKRRSDLVGVRGEWSSVAEASKNIFSTWEWADVWSRHFLADRDVVVGTLRAPDGSVQALVPLYVWSRRPRVLRFLGHGPADQLGPVCDDDDAWAVARAMRSTLQESPELCDVILFDYLPGTQPWRQLTDSSVLRRFQSPVLRYDGDWESYLASQSSNFREQVRRRERKLNQDHDVVFRLGGGGGLERDIETLFDLYEARWAPAGGAFLSAMAFHADFARVADAKGWLRLWFLELDGRPVAAWYGFRFAGVESFYQAGRDPQWADSSVGLVLLAHTIREALNDGIGEYRFLRGGESYKYRFTSEDDGVETTAWARGPLRGSGLKIAAALGDWGPARRVLGRKLTQLPD